MRSSSARVLLAPGGHRQVHLHLRYLYDLMRPRVRRGLVDAFIQAETHLSPTAPLRVVVIAPKMSLPEWRAAQAWLTQLRR